MGIDILSLGRLSDIPVFASHHFFVLGRCYSWSDRGLDVSKTIPQICTEYALVRCWVVMLTNLREIKKKPHGLLRKAT